MRHHVMIIEELQGIFCLMTFGVYTVINELLPMTSEEAW
jgi:hypothetical protein